LAQYILVGLVSGSIYALAALGLVSTYVSSGVLNFSYGAFAYFVARLYYFLHTQHHWAIVPAALFSIRAFSPLAGLVLWGTILRSLARASTLIKVEATIGVSVALPPLADIVFGVQVINTVPGLAPEPVAVYHLFGVSITLDQVIVLSCLVAVLVIGGFVLRFTTAGVIVRAVVDSESMAKLSGLSPQRVPASRSCCSWMSLPPGSTSARRSSWARSCVQRCSAKRLPCCSSSTISTLSWD
jgi:branched-chain amino acid transport system permease protein